MPKLRDTLDADTNRLVTTAENDNSAMAIKAARTRWENSHRAYWRACRDAWRDYQKGKKDSIEALAEQYGVTVSDIAEIAGTPDPEEP